MYQKCKFGRIRNEIYQTRVAVFHRDVQTPRRELKTTSFPGSFAPGGGKMRDTGNEVELKIRRSAEYF